MNENTKILEWLINHAKITEWTDNSMGGQYCEYCSGYLEIDKGQTEHHENCQYVQMMEKAKELLNKEQK